MRENMAVVFEFRSREFRKNFMQQFRHVCLIIHLVPIGNEINQAKKDSSDRDEILKF